MRYHNITKDDMLNGDGLRVVLWLAGCSHHCKECQNPITWNPNVGILFDEEAKQELYSQLEKDYIAGITLSGGDPLYISNLTEVLLLIKEIKEKFPQKNIWLYSGFRLDEIFDLPKELNTTIEKEEFLQFKPKKGMKERSDILSFIDVFIDGRFESSNKDANCEWRGSSNQKIWKIRGETDENN